MQKQNTLYSYGSCNLKGWSTVEYIVGAVLIVSIVGALLGAFKTKLVDSVNSQVQVNIKTAQDAFDANSK